jgi:hypothetical protein
METMPRSAGAHFYPLFTDRNTPFLPHFTRKNTSKYAKNTPFPRCNPRIRPPAGREMHPTAGLRVDYLPK